ncbi:MAG: ferredoxin [Armatimonadetes bacterium]|nr:ferredoxin [Armatimonadota bacterium]
MKVKVIEENCAGEGFCVEEAPGVFEIVDGVAIVKVDEVPADMEDAVRSACEGCPTAAIEIED